MSSTCFEIEGSPSARRFHKHVWYSMFYMHQYKQSCRWKGVCAILFWFIRYVTLPPASNIKKKKSFSKPYRPNIVSKKCLGRWGK